MKLPATLVHGAIGSSPQIVWPLLSQRVGVETWVKHENHLPTGAFKGVGIAMLVECLAGSLSGVYIDRLEHGRTLPASFGGFVLVVNPSLLIGPDAFATHRDAWIGRYKASSKTIRYPGERAAEVEAERTRQGIPLPVTVALSYG